MPCLYPTGGDDPALAVSSAVYFIAGMGLGAHGVGRGLLAAGGALARGWASLIGPALAAFALSATVLLASLAAMPRGGPGPALSLLGAAAFVLSCATISFAWLAVFPARCRHAKPGLGQPVGERIRNLHPSFRLRELAPALAPPCSPSLGCETGARFRRSGDGELLGMAAGLRRIPAVAAVLWFRSRRCASPLTHRSIRVRKGQEDGATSAEVSMLGGPVKGTHYVGWGLVKSSTGHPIPARAVSRMAWYWWLCCDVLRRADLDLHAAIGETTMHRWVSFSTAVTLLLAGSLALAQTAGMEHRDTRRNERAGGRAAKQACKAGDEKTRAECRQMKRDVKHGNVPTVQGGAHPAPTQTPP